MTAAELIGLLVKVSIALMVFGVGLQTSLRDATYLFRRPWLLVRSLLSMHVVMPLVAAVMVNAFDLHPAIKLALLAVSVSPVPPFLPVKLKDSETNYPLALLATTAMLSVVVIPFSIQIFGSFFGQFTGMPPAAVARVVAISILAPLALGILVHEMASAAALKSARLVGHAAMILLVAGVLPILFTSMHAIFSLLGNGTLIAIATFVLVGLIAGHLLGGPNYENRQVLAISTVARHPGVAIAIAHINFPEARLAPAAVLLYLLVSTIVSVPYQKWWRGHGTSDAGIPPVAPHRA